VRPIIGNDLPVEQTADEDYVPVQFESRLTELGVFELWCVNTMSTNAGSWSQRP